MKQFFLFTLNLILFCANLFSQDCPPNGSITFLSQEEVDNFTADYPGCTELNYLYIGHNNSEISTITTLDGLSQLSSVSSIDIRNNPILQNINGLQNVSGELTRLFIFNNDSLENLSGLEGIIEVSDRFSIVDNDALNNLLGLDNLESLTTFNPSVIINNDMLSDLSGLNSLNYIRIIYIENNNNLTNLNGLENVNTIEKLRIEDNDGLINLEGFNANIESLEVINNDALETLIGLGNIANTSNNLKVIIRGNDALTSLNGLNSLDSVAVLTISSNPLLANLEDIAQLAFANTLSITNQDVLTNLSGLENVSINNLSINGNDGLTDLSGLENITELEGLSILHNPNLVNLSGLENLTRIGYSNFGLWILNNDALMDISALSNVKIVENRIAISDNLVLPNLTGLENIEGSYRLNRIYITGNTALSNISALDILPYYWYVDYLDIYDNPNLSVCSEQGICYYITADRRTDIYNNALGCNSRDEILNMCDITNPVCPVGDVTFTSQSQLDSFAINHFNCNRIYGNLTITSPSITNLDALSFIQTIDGDLNICNNPLLLSIYGLSGVEIGGDFWLKNNDALTNTYAQFDFNGGVYVQDNDALQNIAEMTFYMNDITYLQITNNPNLFFCTIIPLSQSNALQFSGSLIGICDYLEDGGPSEIRDNAEGCNSAEQIIGYCTAAPITLTYFQAKIDNKTALLKWETATETNNAGFEIQRSSDGINWEKIAWKDGQGTSVTAHTYTHRDKNPLFGTSYYRLKQIDFDGAFEYSHIVEVSYKRGNISIYPNPVENTLHISNITNEEIQYINIYDQTGREIHSHHTLNNTIDVSVFSPGMYILKIGVNGSIFCEKFIINQ